MSLHQLDRYAGSTFNDMRVSVIVLECPGERVRPLHTGGGDSVCEALLIQQGKSDLLTIHRNPDIGRSNGAFHVVKPGRQGLHYRPKATIVGGGDIYLNLSPRGHQRWGQGPASVGILGGIRCRVRGLSAPGSNRHAGRAPNRPALSFGVRHSPGEGIVTRHVGDGDSVCKAPVPTQQGEVDGQTIHPNPDIGRSNGALHVGEPIRQGLLYSPKTTVVTGDDGYLKLTTCGHRCRRGEGSSGTVAACLHMAKMQQPNQPQGYYTRHQDSQQR